MNLSLYEQSISEEAKVSIRNIRRDFVDLAKDDDSMSEDYQKRLLDDIQKVTDRRSSGNSFNDL